MTIIIAYIFSIGAMIALFVMAQQKSKLKLLLFKLIADACWVVHYFILGALGGVIPNLVGIFREICFSKREKSKFFSKIYIPIFFISINLILGFFTFKEPINIIPIVASMLATIALWQKNPKLTKYLLLPVCLTFFAYDLLINPMSITGAINESSSIVSIVLYLIKEKTKMNQTIFTADFVSSKTPTVYEIKPVINYAKKIEADENLNKNENALAFARDIENNFFSDFEKEGDKMCHVSTFICVGDKVFYSYYANTSNSTEDPDFQVARLVYCNTNQPKNKKFFDIQAAGEELCGHKVLGVYDTIIMIRPDEPYYVYVLWTANIDGKYYRLYRTFNINTDELSDICVNRFKVGDVVNDFSSSGMENALAENGIGQKRFFSDIGIMQKQSWREENGKNYCYSGSYSGNFTCIVKSCDLITWEYVAQPNEGENGTGFENQTKWENAVYVLDDIVYYFVRQWDPEYDQNKNLIKGSDYGILTSYNLLTKEWSKPILVGDCQSRSDFIFYKGELYCFYAPTDREHIGILKIDRTNINNTSVVLQANMNGSCFYPFVNYLENGELGISYTVSRQHVRLAKFNLNEYLK